MGRPNKDGVDYFPHDVDLSGDEKIQLLESDHGILGYAVFCKLLERIYRNGYFIHADERFIKLFSRNCNIEIDACKNIINSCLENLFDKKLYSKFEILTSQGIQKRYMEIVKRRRQIEVISEYLLVNVNGNDENVNIISINVVINPQSKVKESKVNRKERILPLGEFKNIILLEEEFEKLKTQFGEKGTNDRIENLSQYIASKGKKYKSHYATILTWERKNNPGSKNTETSYNWENEIR